LEKERNLSDQSNLISEYKLSLVENWSFLLTALPTQTLYDQIVPNYLSKISELLKSEEVEIRVAAGLLFAFLVQVVRDIEGEQFEIDSSLSSYVDINETLVLLDELVQSKDKTKAKKEQIKQRAPFRDIKKSVMNGIIPSETLEFKHQKFEFDEWHLILQLDRFRNILGEGLQNHFETNGLMSQIFGVIVDTKKPRDKMNAVEKRFFMSPNSDKSKSRTRDLVKKRDARRNESQSFVTEEE